MGRRPNIQTKPCEYCGTPVTKTGTQASQREYWTCGPACSGKLRIARGKHASGWPDNRFRGQRESRTCVVCGKPTPLRFVNEANHDQPWMCSRSCAATYRIAHPVYHGDTVPCAVCGAMFYRQPKFVVADRKYCSVACASIGRQSVLTEKRCAHCGKTMTLRPSGLTRQFCSRECWREAKYKHALTRQHNGRPARLTHEGYVKVWEPTHPKAVQGWVLEHRLLMERHLGRPLSSEEEVDHINSDRSDNRLENLQVLAKGAHRKKTGADARKRRMTMRERLAEYERRFGPLE